MKHRILTISREFGSGGRTIGKQTAEQLKIPCYDKQLIQQIAQESGFAEEYVKSVDESYESLAASVFSTRAMGPPTWIIFGEFSVK